MDFDAQKLLETLTKQKANVEQRLEQSRREVQVIDGVRQGYLLAIAELQVQMNGEPEEADKPDGSDEPEEQNEPD